MLIFIEETKQTWNIQFTDAEKSDFKWNLFTHLFYKFSKKR